MRDHNYFEDWARHNKMFPQKAVDTALGRILLADSEDLIKEDGKLIYRTGYAIERGKMEIGAHCDYDAVDFALLTREAGRAFRIAEAELAGRTLLAQTTEAGLYDDSRKESFSKRPN